MAPPTRPRKRFGQNFLVDASFVARIVEAIGPGTGEIVVEIGPGRGALTGPLLARLPHLHAIEIDRDLAAALAARFPPERLTVHRCDALTFDFGQLGRDLRVVGNLPYNVSTPLLFHVAGYEKGLRDVHAMLQREVVARMTAAPGGAEYGRLSVMLQYRFRIERLFTVPAGAFRPVPKVESAFVRLVPLGAMRPAVTDEALLGRLVTAAFTQRRKTLRNALSAYFSEQALAALEVDPGARPETIPVPAFVRLANAVAARAADRP